MGYNKIKKVLCLVAMAVLMVGCGNSDGEHDDTTVDESKIEVTKFSMPEEIPKSDKVEFVNLTLNTTEAYYFDAQTKNNDNEDYYKSFGYSLVPTGLMDSEEAAQQHSVNFYDQNRKNMCRFNWNETGCNFYVDNWEKYADTVSIQWHKTKGYNLQCYAEKVDFSFGTSDQIIKKIEDDLNIEFNEEWQIEVYYLDHNILQSQKEARKKEWAEYGMVGYEQEWVEADDAYLFFIRPLYCGLSCYYRVNGQNEFEAANCTMMIIYNKSGIVKFDVSNMMEIESLGTAQELLPFEEIVDIVFDEYDSLLDDYTYKITGATLFCHANDKKVYPAWHFDLTTTDGDKLEFTIPIMVNAITGEFMKDPL